MSTASPVRVRWLGHATVQIDIAGLTVLTDPALTSRLAHLKRHHVVDPLWVDAPDVILISHVHLDHLHLPSLRRFGREVLVIAPAGAGGLLRRHGFRNVTEVRAGDTTSVGVLTVETVPAVHPRGRLPHGRVAADPVGYVLRAPRAAVYFPGDTGPFDEMATWAPVDVALLPIWGWGSAVGEGHLDPTTAREAVQKLQPGLVVPIHWGTYSPVGLWRPRWLDTPVDRFRAELAAHGSDGLLRVLAPGDELALGPRASSDPRDAER